jgi:hypothetical protein
MTSHKTVWIAALAAPLAWFCDLVISYASTPPAYRHGLATMSYAVSLSSAVIVLLSAIVLGMYLRRAPVWECRTRFVARAGLWISLLSLVLVVGMAIPNFLLAPGAEP